MARPDEERLMQPFIHNVLLVTAWSLNRMIGSTRRFLVATEPAVVPHKKDYLANEALYEDITVSTEAKTTSKKHLMRVLLKVKGENDYPYELSRNSCSDKGDKCMSQVLQQVGLAYNNDYWTEGMLCGLVSVRSWLLFKMAACEVRSQVFLKIVESFHHNFYLSPKDRYPTDAVKQELKHLILFLMHYLDR
jgi:hypothetical protein